MTVPIKKEKITNRSMHPVVGFVLSAILLTVIQAPFNVHWLAWIAWVPFMLACHENFRTRWLLLTAYGFGLVWWLGNLYWVMPLTLPGYIAFGMVQACYWPVLAFGVRFVRRKGWHLFLTAPLLFAGAEAIQGVLFTGFSWYFLAHSQYRNLHLIQISDIFGALGVSVLIAMINGLMAQLILKKKLLRSWEVEVGIICVLLAGTWLYGHYRLGQTADCTTEGPKVGAVQPNLPSHVKEAMENGQKILDELIRDSEQCMQAGAGLVVWPETIVLSAMNMKYREATIPGSTARRYHEQISNHTKDKGYVLFGAHTADLGLVNGEYDVTDQYNTAFLYRPNGLPDPQTYSKIHLVPFGEYIPFKKSAPLIYKIILALSPYDYDYNLTPGDKYTTFNIVIGEQDYSFGVLICYEDTDPTVTRRLVLDKNGNKKADWLVNISNDGWYVFYKEQQIIPTVELSQRVAISVFRCIENRISIVRSVNTGISCLIEPDGSIRDDFQAGSLPERAMARQGVAGWFVDTVPIDSRVTFFSRHGRWLDLILGTGFVVIIGLGMRDSLKKKKIEGNAKDE